MSAAPATRPVLLPVRVACAFGEFRGWRFTTVIVTATVVVTTAIAWFRLPALARDTLWAEDGRTFLSPAASPDALLTVFTPYAGYLHVLPRLIALAVAHLVPVADWALAMTFLSSVIAGVVAGIVVVCSAAIVPWLPARVLLAGLTVLTPLASREVLGNAANLHSLLLWGAFWLVLAVPRRPVAGVAVAIAVLLFALTEIQVLFLLPLLLVNRRIRSTWPMKAALLLGVAAQVVATLASPRPPDTAQADSPASIAYGWVINAVLTSWAPRAWVGAIVAGLGPALLVVLVIPVASIAAILVWGRPAQRLVALALLALGIVVWTTSVVLDPHSYLDYARPAIAGSGQVWLVRYAVVPAMTLLAETAIAASVLAQRGARRGPAIAVVAVLAVALALQAPTTDTRRSTGPQWSSQIPAAVATCATGGSQVQLRETLGWHVTVPCADLHLG